MILKEVLDKKIKSFGNGNFSTVSILDREGETITVVSVEDLSTLDEKYLNATFLSAGSSSIKPDRLRIRIDTLREN